MSTSSNTNDDALGHYPRPKETDFASVVTILIGGSILVLGVGLQGSLLSIRASVDNLSSGAVGLMMSCYFIGYAGGSILAPYYLKRVGHIRSFAAFASILSASALCYLFETNAVYWIFLRVVQGACYGSMILVIETWLNSATKSADRGRVLSLYQAVLLAAWVVSQLLLNVAPPSAATLFCLVSILLSLSLVPMALSKVEQPLIITPNPVSLKYLYTLSPLGFAGAFVAGITFNTYVTMTPLFGAEKQMDTYWISLLVSSMLLGGFLLQWPLGRWSDTVDRRFVIVVMAICSGVSTLAMGLFGDSSLGTLLGLGFLFGASSLALYPICIAHINDFVAEEERIGAASGLILVYGLGAVIGPFCSGIVMNLSTPSGLYLFLAAVLFSYAGFSIYRFGQRLAVTPSLKEEFVSLPRTTYASLELDERLTETEPIE
jgi:MFS family permease